MPDTNTNSEFRFTAYMVTGVVRAADLVEPNGEVLNGFLLATSRGDAENHHIAWMAKVRPDHTVMWCRAIPIAEHDLILMASKVLEHQARAMAPTVPVANDARAACIKGAPADSVYLVAPGLENELKGVTNDLGRRDLRVVSTADLPKWRGHVTTVTVDPGCPVDEATAVYLDLMSGKCIKVPGLDNQWFAIPKDRRGDWARWLLSPDDVGMPGFARLIEGYIAASPSRG